MTLSVFFRLLWHSAFELISICLLLWIGGLFWFASTLDEKSANAGPTDAIVVLTGGSGRLEAGLALLRAGKGKKLFISGVHPSVDLTHLFHGHETDRWIRCCVVLGHAADNTIGNARETANWLKGENYHSFRLVTANYHMRRSLLEFRRVLPADITIIPEPVRQPGTEERSWWLWRSGEKIVVTEYMKFLAAWLRPRFVDGSQEGRR